ARVAAQGERARLTRCRHRDPVARLAGGAEVSRGPWLHKGAARWINRVPNVERLNVLGSSPRRENIADAHAVALALIRQILRILRRRLFLPIGSLTGFAFDSPPRRRGGSRRSAVWRSFATAHEGSTSESARFDAPPKLSLIEATCSPMSLTLGLLGADAG